MIGALVLVLLLACAAGCVVALCRRFPALWRPIRWACLTLPLAALLVGWIYAMGLRGDFKGGPGNSRFGVDVDVYLAAASVIQHGGNPYDNVTLYRAEMRMLSANRLQPGEKPALVRVGSPPLFFWALQPLTHLPVSVAALWWIVSLYLLSGIALLILLRALAWGWRACLPGVLLFLAMPQTIRAAYNGDVTDLYFIGLVLAVALARRYPLLSGACLGAAWLKPPVALPLALLVILFSVDKSRRVATGFIAVSACQLLFTFAVTGPDSVSQWIHGMIAFAGGIRLQLGLVSASGLYLSRAPDALRLALQAGSLLAVASLTARLWWLWRTRRLAPDAYLILWPLWLLAMPYAHYPEEIALAIPILFLLGRNACRIGEKHNLILLAVAAISPLASSWSPYHGVQLDPLLAAIMALCFLPDLLHNVSLRELMPFARAGFETGLRPQTGSAS